MDGMITKEEYANTLHAYQKIRDDAKSDDRVKRKNLRDALGGLWTSKPW